VVVYSDKFVYARNSQTTKVQTVDS
jgi:hypothetical protein